MNKKIHTNCPTTKAAILLSDVWTMLIIRDLLRSKMRFCELENSLDGISTRTLSLKLKRLEEENILTKSDLYYLLTKKGKGLKKVLSAMEAWGKNSL